MCTHITAPRPFPISLQVGYVHHPSVHVYVRPIHNTHDNLHTLPTLWHNYLDNYTETPLHQLRTHAP